MSAVAAAWIGAAGGAAASVVGWLVLWVRYTLTVEQSACCDQPVSNCGCRD